MPTYEFACPCGHQEDRVASIKSPPSFDRAWPCPTCRRTTLVRVIGTAPEMATAALRASMKYPYVSRQHSAQKLGTEHATPEGHAIVTSRQEERNIMARTGMVRE